METLTWSELPLDILRSLFELLSFVDFHRAKMVCSDWYSVSKQTVPRKSLSPYLILFPGDSTDCLLYKPYEKDIIYTRAAPSRLLASCGKWLLMIDSRSRLYVIDVFNGNKIDLPPLESLKSNNSSLKRMEDRDKVFEWEFSDRSVYLLHSNELRGRLWIDEKTDELALVWFFDSPACFLGFYKKGNAHYDLIPITYDIARILTGMLCLVLRGYRLYILTLRRFVRIIDFSRQHGFEKLTGTWSDPSPKFPPPGCKCYFSIAITTAGEVLFVTSTKISQMAFRIYKMDPNAEPDDHMPDLLDVDSLGDEALLLDLGITVPANHSLGIKPNSIYFTHYNLIRSNTNWNKFGHVLPLSDVDICVFDLSTKTLEPFPAPSNMSLKDARWIFS